MTGQSLGGATSQRRARAAALTALATVALAGAPGWATPTLVAARGADGQQLVSSGQYVWASLDARYATDGDRLLPRQGLFALTGSATAPSLSARLWAPPTVARGAPLRAYVTTSAVLSAVTVGLDAAGGASTSTAAFDARPQAPAVIWAAIVGVPSTAAPGGAVLRVEAQLDPDSAGSAGAHQLLLIEPITIAEREFASQHIPLSSALTDLRRSPDPRKADESRVLARLLRLSRPAAIHHLGALDLPLGNVRRTSGFGDRRAYEYADGSTALSVHNGVDFAVPAGTPVVAAGGGVVVMAQSRLVTGLTVVIEHLPGVYSLYYHLSRLQVSAGQPVVKGAVIGAVGSTGLATGAHLHWEVRAAGVAIDPDLVVVEPLVDIPVDVAMITD